MIGSISAPAGGTPARARLRGTFEFPSYNVIIFTIFIILLVSLAYILVYDYLYINFIIIVCSAGAEVARSRSWHIGRCLSIMYYIVVLYVI